MTDVATPPVPPPQTMTLPSFPAEQSEPPSGSTRRALTNPTCALLSTEASSCPRNCRMSPLAAPTTAEASGKKATQRKCCESLALGPVLVELGVTVVRAPPLALAQNLRCFAPHCTICGPPTPPLAANGLYSSASTSLPWPRASVTTVVVARRQSRTLMVWWSSPPTTARRWPSGENERQLTRRSATFCSRVTSRIERQSQMQTAAWRPTCPVATVTPSGWSAIATMSSSCAVKKRCVLVSKLCTTPTAATKYSSSPSAVKSRLLRQSEPR